MDTGVFDGDRYFDVFVEYAKAGAEDILIAITACNRGPEPAPLHLLPTVWFRNTWSWTADVPRPSLAADPSPPGTSIRLDDPIYGRRVAALRRRAGAALHRERDQHRTALRGARTPPYAKDGFDDAVVHGRLDAVNPEHRAPRPRPTTR